MQEGYSEKVPWGNSCDNGMGAIGVGGRLLGSLMKLIPAFGLVIAASLRFASCLTGAMGFLFKEMFKRIRSKAFFGELAFDHFRQVMNRAGAEGILHGKVLGASEGASPTSTSTEEPYPHCQCQSLVLQFYRFKKYV